MKRFKVTSIECNNPEGKNYVSSYEFDTLEESKKFIENNCKQDWNSHFDDGDDDGEEAEPPYISWFGDYRAEMYFDDDYTQFIYLIEDLGEHFTVITESFFYYMWNMWSKRECLSIKWGINADHIWSKWSYYYDKYGSSGAIAGFFADLDTTNRTILVNRANEYYEGRNNRK